MKASSLLKFSLYASLFLLPAVLPADALAAPGTIVWEADYLGSPGKDSVMAKGLAIGPKGEVAVAGHNEHNDGNYNYLIIKYGPYGATEWIREYDYSWFEAGKAIAFDKGGDIVVAGSANNLENPRDSYSGAYYKDYRLIKYSKNGDLLSETAASGYNKNNDPAGVAVDGAGNVYATGMAMNAPNTFPVFYTVKFGPDGSLLWEKVEEWGSEAYGTAIAMDGSDSPIVAGYFKDPSTDSYSIRVLRYDPESGRTVMDAVYNVASENEKAWGVAVDGEGNIFVTGETDADDGVTLTLKYGPDGGLLWARKYKEAGYRNRGNAVAADGSGKVYVAGKVFKEDQAGDWLLLAYGPGGRPLLDRTYPFGGDGSAESAAIDIYGNVVVTGNIITPAGTGQQSVIRTVRFEGFRETAGLFPGLAFSMPYAEWIFTDLLTPAISLLSGRLGRPDKVKLCPLFN